MILQASYSLRSDQLWMRGDTFRTLTSRNRVDSSSEKAKKTVESEGSCWRDVPVPCKYDSPQGRWWYL